MIDFLSTAPQAHIISVHTPLERFHHRPVNQPARLAQVISLYALVIFGGISVCLDDNALSRRAYLAMAFLCRFLGDQVSLYLGGWVKCSFSNAHRHVAELQPVPPLDVIRRTEYPLKKKHNDVIICHSTEAPTVTSGVRGRKTYL